MLLSFDAASFERKGETIVVELRRHARVPVDISVELAIRGSDERTQGRATDISIGGMFVRVEQPFSFNAAIVVYAQLPGQSETVVLPGVVRWVRDGGMGVQFGLLGARETHAITKITRAAGG
jgi:type IV pilus assembly protein PilZ